MVADEFQLIKLCVAFVDFAVERMGLCIAANTRIVDTNIAASNANHLHARY